MEQDISQVILQQESLAGDFENKAAAIRKGVEMLKATYEPQFTELASLKEQKPKLEEQIVTLQTKVDEKLEDIFVLNKSLDEAQTLIERRDVDIETLKAEIETLKNPSQPIIEELPTEPTNPDEKPV